MPNYSPDNRFGHAAETMAITALELGQKEWRNRLAQIEAAGNLAERTRQAISGGTIPPEQIPEFLERMIGNLTANPYLPIGYRLMIRGLLLEEIT